MFRRQPAQLCFDGIQLAYSFQGFLCENRGCADMDVVDFAAGMGPAGRFCYTAGPV